MNEYEKLKWICDEIGYEHKDITFNHTFWIVRKRAIKTIKRIEIILYPLTLKLLNKLW